MSDYDRLVEALRDVDASTLDIFMPEARRLARQLIEELELQKAIREATERERARLQEENERLHKACGSLDTHEALQARLSGTEHHLALTEWLYAEAKEKLSAAQEEIRKVMAGKWTAEDRARRAEEALSVAMSMASRLDARVLRAEEVVKLYKEYYVAHQMVEEGLASFDLHNDAVTRLERARDAVCWYEETN